MPNWPQLLFVYLPLAISFGSICYFIGVFMASLRFQSEREIAAAFTPPVSILKPCAGTEPHFYETLRSHFLQDYPEFEILFCVKDESDPALWTIRMLQHDFPTVPSRVIFVADIPDANPKMVKLREMVEQARHEVLVISDADIAVEPGYLRQVVAPLRDEKVGMVTCLYRGVPARGLNSLFEALSMAGDFVGQVLLGRMLGGMRFGLGATMATHKEQIRAIGGLTPWLHYLADDFILGNKIAASGRTVHLSRVVVTTCLPKRSWRASFQQQLRWARTIRSCSPGGYPGLIFAYGLPISLMLLFARDAWMWQWIVPATVVARLFAAWASGVGVARDPLIRKYFWLLPLRDLWALMIWVYSFLGSQIVWRSRRYRLDAGGKLSRLPG